MTESEAIEELKYDCNELGKAIPCDTSWGCSFENAYGMAIQALEKQIPMKPIFNHNLSDTLSVFHCECGNTIKVSHDVGIMNNNNVPNYCSKCGCRLDWSDDDEID